MGDFNHVVEALARWSAVGHADCAGDDDAPLRSLSLGEDLRQTVEGEIIPRLMLAHRAAPRPAGANGLKPTSADVEALFPLVLKPDGAASAHIAALLDRGMTPHTVLLDVLAPTARHLGKLWEEDLCDFVDVTIGLTRLHKLIYETGLSDEPAARATDDAPRVMLLPTSGEQHTLGLVIVEQFFRHAGWDVWSPARIGHETDRLALVASRNFSTVGFSLGSLARMDALAADIQAVRRQSANSHQGDRRWAGVQ